MRQRVELADELDRLDVLPPAVAIRNPLPFAPRVIEVEHRRDGIDAQTVDVVLVQPVEGVRQQVVADLVAAVVEDQRAPVAMLPLAGVGVFEERRAVEPRQRVRVAWKVPGHPVEDHADTCLVADVHERLELLRRAETARRRVEAGDLVAPRSRKRMLHHRQQLDVRVAHLLHVRNEPRRQLRVGQVALAVVAGACPRTEVDLVDRHGPLEPRLLGRAPGHPGCILPLVPGDRDDRGRQRRNLEGEAERIDLQEQLAAARAQLELVALAHLRRRDEISHTPLEPSERIGCTRPSHSLKSPTTLTRMALGAQTAK